MDYDELEEEYNPLEDTGSTEYWQNEWEKEKIEKEEEEKKLAEEVELYFKCSNPKCGNVTKVKVQVRQIDEISEQFKNTTCKICSNKGFVKIDKKEYEKLEKEFVKKQKNKDKEKEIDIEKMERGIKENIVDDVKDLLDDLSTRLLNDKMSSKAFVNIFYKLSMNITSKYYKELPGGTSASTYSYYRTTFLGLCDRVLERFNVNEEAEFILEGYNLEIEENKEYLDELYQAYYDYYINDEKYSVADFEMKERIEEYDRQKNKIFAQEAKRAQEEEYQQRRKLFEEKYEKRMKNRELRSLLK